MSKTLEKYIVRLEAEIGKYQKEFDKADKRHKDFSKNFAGSMNVVKAAIAAVGFGALVSKVVSATTTQEAAVKQLEATWKSTGGVVGQSVDQMIKEAGRLQGVTIFGDEQIIKAQSQLLTFTKITGDQFNRTTEAALNMAVKLDTDLKGAVMQLGKALNDPIKGVASLGEAGVQFTNDQKELIKTLVETGRLADAQNIILAEMETQFGGSATAARETFGGALKGLNNAFGDLFEADSMAGAIDGIEELTTLLSDPQTKAAAGTLANAIVTAFEWAAKAITKTVNVVKDLSEGLAAYFNGPAFDDVERRQAKIADLTNKIADAEERLQTLRNAPNARTRALAGDQERKLAALTEERDKLLEVQKIYEDMQKSGADNLNSAKHGAEGGGSQNGGDQNKKNEEDRYDEYGLGSGRDPFKAKELELDEYDRIYTEWRQAELKKDQEFHEQKIRFQQYSTSMKVKTALGEGIALTQGAANTSKKLFAINKALALTNAIVNLPEHVSQTMSKYPYPWSIGMGALAAASSVAQINAIRKTKFGSTSPSLAGTTGGAIPVADVNTNAANDALRPQEQTQQRGTTNIIINGDIFGIEDFEEKLLDTVAQASGTNRLRVTDQTGQLRIERT